MRSPLTFIPQVDRLTAGSFTETAGYHVLRPRGTTDYLMILTTGGGGIFRERDGHEIPLHPGTTILIKPGTPHDYEIAEQVVQWHITYCHFHPRPEWRPLLDWPAAGPGVGSLALGPEVESRVADQLTRAGFFARSGRRHAELRATHALEDALLWCDTRNPSAAVLDERIIKVLEHIDKHLADPLRISDLARVAHLSVSRFAHVFSSQLGVSPAAYVDEQRMALAQQLLNLTGRPVYEVARSVGFPDPLHFSTRFRQVTGRSPTAFRNESDV